MEQLHIKKGQPYPLGASIRNSGVNFSMVNSSNEECGIILYRKDTQEQEKIPFDHNHRIGNICCLYIEGIQAEQYEYNYYIGNQIVVDSYARRVYGNEEWGRGLHEEITLRGGVYQSHFDWQKTSPLRIPYHESIFYCLHVRGFTRHSSSKVKHKGTFEGMIEKLPYLKELGITAVELLPSYEFEECEKTENTNSIEYQVQHIDEKLSKEQETSSGKLNYWGFKKAFYFAPKASYASSDDPCMEFKCMVREFHKNGIEVIMQFYFPEQTKQGFILEIIRYWVMEYRIDGVHLIGKSIPLTLLATDPLLTNTKLMGNDFALNEIYPEQETPIYKNLGFYRNEFMNEMRKFLKGDFDMLGSFCYHMRNHNPKCGIINYITNYNGFTLADLVSYERKHNELNGENNCDGTDYNYSWNCGIEGPTRKKQIMELRKKQMRNAMCFLMTAQGTPLILAGDEFCNSQKGNNNCYCQDNELSWLDWRNVNKNEGFLNYVKELIHFRKAHSVLHTDVEMSMADQSGNGYPDLSYHSEEAWKARMDNYRRHIGMMYCSPLPSCKDKWDNDYIYIAYNMHWEAKNFALPTLPGGYDWEPVLDTQKMISEKENMEEHKTGKCQNVEVAPRSIKILLGRKQIRKRRSRKKH